MPTQKERILFNKTCAAMKMLHDDGKTNAEIETTIKDIPDMPLSIILGAMAHFTEIITYGRPLTKNERDIGIGRKL
jgi:metal-dependent HD superfamily phosphatase/phosphodiesterase